MVFMYGINAKRQGWWDEVTIIVWGATVDLVGENEKIQELIKEAQLEGGAHHCLQGMRRPAWGQRDPEFNQSISQRFICSKSLQTEKIV